MTRINWLDWPELDFPTALVRTMQPFLGQFPGRPYVPAVDVFKKGVDLFVKVELPGIDPAKDVKVTVEDGYLVIHGERHEAEEVKEEGYFRKETLHGVFERRIPVPEGIEEKVIKAEYKDGILLVKVPNYQKAVEKTAPKEIPIHVG